MWKNKRLTKENILRTGGKYLSDRYLCVPECAHTLVLHLQIFSKEALSLYAGVGYSERCGVTEVTMAISRKDLKGNWLMG